ncbi:MAG TPA: hypothetical protein VM715_08280 [Candidatus Acidoferrum sp.]|nr:hypothetical protein [Candidatus Acidoferrum sp.]
MAKSKDKEEVIEDVSWTVSCTIIGQSQEDIESMVENIEENLDNAADGIMTDMTNFKDFKVRLN